MVWHVLFLLHGAHGALLPTHLNHVGADDIKEQNHISWSSFISKHSREYNRADALRTLFNESRKIFSMRS